MRIVKSFLTVVLCMVPSLTFAAMDIEELSINPKDRILVIAPHPDDEVLGTAGVLQRAVAKKVPHKVVFLTHGDGNPWSFLVYRKRPVFMPRSVKKMGLLRRDEAVKALNVLGVLEDDIEFLGYPDFGTLNIWNSHWDDRSPYRSVLTRVTHVPYQGAFRPNAPYKGEEMLADLRSILRDFKPTKVFVSHPSDLNTDHLACYLFLKVALWDEGMAPEILPFLIHYPKWPTPYGFHPKDPLLPPEGLSGAFQWKKLSLTEGEFELKKKALLAHQTQYKASQKYLLSFIKYNELFGDIPTFFLKPNEEFPVFSAKKKMMPGPEELRGRERNLYVSLEWKLLRRDGDNLVISIELSKPLAEDVEASIYIFGYKSQVPFAKMPKINVRLKTLSYSVYDKNRRIDQKSVKIERSPKEVTLTVPLEVLGSPEKILASGRTYLGNVPLDNVSWVTAQFE